jgi:hypothetical protein
MIINFIIAIEKIFIATPATGVTTATFPVRIFGKKIAISGLKVLIHDLEMAIFKSNIASTFQPVRDFLGHYQPVFQNIRRVFHRAGLYAKSNKTSRISVAILDLHSIFQKNPVNNYIKYF